MGQLKLSGLLTGGPPAVMDGSFPASTWLVSLGFAQGCAKEFGAASGVLTRSVASANAFIPLSGIGADDAVTQVNALYLKCNTSMQIRVTFHPLTGPDYTSVIPLNGVLLIETPDDQYITGLEVMGVGPIEYLATGLQ